MLVVSLLLLAVLVLAGGFSGRFGYLHAQAALTLLGISAGSVMALLNTWVMPRFPRLSVTALLLLAVSQGAFHTLVWTDAKRDDLGYRIWWVATVAAITATHLLALRPAATSGTGPVDRIVPGCAAASGLLLAVLAFWGDLPAKPPAAFWVVLAIPSSVSIAGTWLIWNRRRPKVDDRAVPMAPWAKVAWVIASHAGVFSAGLYAGHAGGAGEETHPSALSGLAAETVASQLETDLGRLKQTAAGLDDLMAKWGVYQAEVEARRLGEGREFYRPEEDDRLRWHFVTFLSYRDALLRIAATYGNPGSVADPAVRIRCFLVGYAAAGTAYEATLTLADRCGRLAPAVKKLNEGEPRWGLRPGTYDAITSGAVRDLGGRMFREMGLYHGEKRAQWGSEAGLPGDQYRWLDERIGRNLKATEARLPGRARQWIDRLTRRVKADLYSPTYAAQSLLSTLIGDLRIVRDAPLIPAARIKREIEPLLKPGDILLERRNWYLSNAFLPGFWPHAALYVGRPEDLRNLGLEADPEVRRRWKEYAGHAGGGDPHTVVEAVSEGVVFNTLAHSMNADYVAVLRPRRLAPEQIGRAIARAFSHQGKPYDFEFDFFTSDKLVCTEVVYRSYEGFLHFDLARIMGRDTLPAIDIGRKFARERGVPEGELDLVLFIDGAAGSAGEEAFIDSLERPGAFGE